MENKLDINKISADVITDLAKTNGHDFCRYLSGTSIFRRKELNENGVREVAIYKMHGDKDSPDDVVLTKEDYQNYDIDRGIFTRMLSVELIRKSFVFIGFSFNDPNLERILSIAKQTLQGKAPQTHYCFMRKVQLIDYLNEHNRLEMDLEKKNRIRRKMIEQCSSSIIVFGYGKKDSGTYQEYHIAKDDNKYIIPVKKTGFAAKEIYNGLPKKEKQELLFLEKENEISVVIKEIVNLLILHKKRTEIELKEKIYSGIALSGIKVFISYHYESDNAIAKEIADIVNSEKTNIFTVIEEQKKSNNSKEIKKWVDEEILKTKFTILLISKDTFQREYVSYEIKKSKENRNTFIPILIDNEKNIGLEQKTNQVKELLNVINCEPTRFWYRDEGGKNIVRWLNDALHVSEKV